MRTIYELNEKDIARIVANEFDVDITVTSEWKDIEDFYGGN